MSSSQWPLQNGPNGHHALENANGYGQGPQSVVTGDVLEILCGPLLNYQRMSKEGDQIFWHGSVLIVAKPGQKQPRLELQTAGSAAQTKTTVKGIFSKSSKPTEVEGLKLYADPAKAFWRFTLKLPLGATEARWQYTIPNMKFLSSVSTSPSRTFVVPSSEESMRIMFHSCNGFSVGTDEDFWSGPALWNDVLRTHDEKAFHVMIGGGDQIYNDGVRVNGPLKPWTDIKNPKKRRDFPFDEQMRSECDSYYFENYVRWYSTEPFATANAQIPQINIWDDHDIIDGFGSYTDHFMKCAVFRGIGGVSFRYYCLFQHHTAPPRSTFTTDAQQTMQAVDGGSAGIDERQLKDTFVYKETADDPSWVVGTRPGPYVEERSRNLVMRLGKRILFCGIDARTERTRHRVNYPETYNLIFDRLKADLAASNGELKHLILLLGVPIAYPRLAWLENIFSSPIIAPIRLLNKRFGVAGGFFNHFDGSVDLLDDLDDHYTAKHHKHERKEFIMRLQELSRQFSLRITILGGDVHLAALGRFYSNPKLAIPVEHDHRYMANIISSAITNKPPPKAVANLLARRNRIHHLDHDTDETLLKMFDRQPGGMEKGAEWNKCTMPSRNYATITETVTVTTGEVNGTVGSGSVNANVNLNVDGVHASAPQMNGESHETGSANGNDNGENHHHPAKAKAKDGHFPLHRGEEGAGTTHPAADGINSSSGMIGGLDVAIKVEIDNHDSQGRTEGYGFSIPPLVVSP